MNEIEKSNLLSALKESQNRLNAIIEAAVDGIITIDKKGKVLSMNKAALELFQYHETEIIGKKINMLMPKPHSRDHDQYLHNYHSTSKKKIIGIGRQVEGKRKDGTIFPFRLSVSEVELDNENIYTGIIHDITEQIKAEKELKKLNESLEATVDQKTKELRKTLEKLELLNNSLSKEILKRKESESDVRKLLEKEIELGTLKSRFVSMASHEFRTPLTGILSSANLIEKFTKSEENDKRQKLLSIIKTSVRNLTGILNDFLSLDKLQSGSISIHPSLFSISDLVHEIKMELEPIMKSNVAIKLKNEIKDDEIYQDRNILKNVLVNLLSNALKYSDKDIDLKLKSDNRSIEIEVQDYGIGIPEADKKHMFDRFFRASNATLIKGTGLGLNIVKRYMDLLSGSISFKSTEGVGTCFYVSIPLN